MQAIWRHLTIPLSVFFALGLLSSSARADEQKHSVNESVCKELTPVEPQYRFNNLAMVQFPKRFLDCAPQAVLEAARKGFRADVRFTDVVEKTDITDELGLSGFRMGFTIYTIGHHPLRTRQGLNVSVPSIHYAEWMQPSRERMAELKPGDTVVVEGTVYAGNDGKHVVTAERILEPGERSVIRHELRLKLPDQDQPFQTLSAPGRSDITLPGDANTKANNRLTVDIKQMRQSQLLAQLKAMRFGGPDRDKKTYQPITADQMGTLGDASGKDVTFTDRVRTIGIVQGPRSQVTTPTGMHVGIAARFITDNGIECLIPTSQSTLIERATRAVLGQTVTFEGTLIMPTDGNPAIILDEFRYAHVEGEREDADSWLVQVSLSDGRAGYLAGPGTYHWPLAGSDVSGESPVLTIVLDETREIIRK